MNRRNRDLKELDRIVTIPEILGFPEATAARFSSPKAKASVVPLMLSILLIN